MGFYVVSRPFLAAGGAGVQALRSDKSLVAQYYTSGRQLLNLGAGGGGIGGSVSRHSEFFPPLQLLPLAASC